jgi:hypothetical protein
MIESFAQKLNANVPLSEQSKSRLIACIAVKIQCDSKLLPGFPWPIIFNPENSKIKLLTEYENATQKVILDTK